MIDFHSHILPSIDDGSSGLEETARMLVLMQEQGVSCVMATPHFYAERMSFKHFLERRTEAFQKVQNWREANLHTPIPEIRVGAEVYYFPGVGKADMLPRLCLEGTDIVLLELPFVQWTEKMLEDITDIMKRQKLKVMLAHVERYYEFQKKKTVWDAVMDLPVYIQINAGSLKNRKKRKLELSIIQSGKPVVMGSDCHNMEHRLPNLPEGRGILRDKLGEEALQHMDELGKRVLAEHE